jgi:hypothetical protein
MFPIKRDAAKPKTTMTIKDDALHTFFWNLDLKVLGMVQFKKMRELFQF